MKKTFVTMLFLIFMSTISWGQPQPLELSLKTAKPVYETGDEIDVQFIFKNISKADIELFVFEDEYPLYHDFEFTDLNGQQLVSGGPQREVKAKEIKRIDLNPGDTFKTSVPLDQWTLVYPGQAANLVGSTPGKFVVKGMYFFPIGINIVTTEGKQPFLGKLISAPLAITVVNQGAASGDFSTKKENKVSFQLIRESDLKPIANRRVYVFNGDYRFKAGPNFDPYPYNASAKEKEWFLGIVQTDDQGKFVFDITQVKAQYIYFQLGLPYRLIRIEKSWNLSHWLSNSHLRLILLEKGSTKVARNDIYDLSKGVVKKSWIDGRSEEQAFEDVVLIVQEEAGK